MHVMAVRLEAYPAMQARAMMLRSVAHVQTGSSKTFNEPFSGRLEAGQGPRNIERMASALERLRKFIQEHKGSHAEASEYPKAKEC